jgi:ankyrin repeat protein
MGGSSIPTAAGFSKALRDKDVAAVTAALAERPELADARLEDGLSPLMFAIYLRSTPLIEVLRAKGAVVGVHEAAALGDAHTLRSAFRNDDRAVTGHSPDGWTALHLAAHFGRIEAIDALLDGGAAVGARSANANRNTPLHAAAAGGQAGAVRHLLRKGAPVDATDAGGNTALHIGAASGFEAVVDALLKAGADPSLANRDGKTPRQLAEERGAQEVLERLTA